MSGPSKSPSKHLSKGGVNTTNSQRKGGTGSGKSEGQNIYVFTPSKLKELGFVTKVEDGKTVLIKGQSTASILKHAINTDGDRGISLVGRSSESVSRRPSTDSSPSTSTVESPNRRRIIQGFSRHWAESLKKDGFIKCPLRLCTFISLRHVDMCAHYIKCNGLANNTEYLCTTCKCCLKTRDDLELHIGRTHNNANIDPKIVGSPAVPCEKPSAPLSHEQLIVRKRGYSKVHKQAWTISIEEKGYVKCIFQNCIFMALSVEEMIEHYRCCNSKGVEKLFVCPHCEGGVRSEEKLAKHVSLSHSEGGASGDEPASKTKAPSSQPHSKPEPRNAEAMKKLVTKPQQGMATERWNSFLKSPPSSLQVADKQLNKISSPRKKLSPTKRPCYAPERDLPSERQHVEAARSPPPAAPAPAAAPLAAVVDKAVAPPRPPSVMILAGSGQVCTFFKRRPNSGGGVELFPGKVCTFVKNARLSKKRRLSDDNDGGGGGSKRSRIGGLSPGSDVALPTTSPQLVKRRDRTDAEADAGDPLAQPPQHSHFYIGESNSREVVYQEENAEEPEYIISDMMDSTEPASSNDTTVEIKYFERIVQEGGEIGKEETDDTERNENKSPLLELKQEIVADDVSNDELNIATNGGNNCSRFAESENNNLEQLPLQIADNFVSDRLTSDSVQAEILYSEELVDRYLPPESSPITAATESNATARYASIEEDLMHEDFRVNLIEENHIQLQNAQVFLTENGNLGAYNEASKKISLPHNSGTMSACVEVNLDIESNLPIRVLDCIQLRKSNSAIDEDVVPVETCEVAVKDEEPVSNTDATCDVESNSDYNSDLATPRPHISPALDSTNHLWMPGPQELGQIGNSQHSSHLATTQTLSDLKGQSLLSDASWKHIEVNEFVNREIRYDSPPNVLYRSATLEPGSPYVANDDATLGPDNEIEPVFSSQEGYTASSTESKSLQEHETLLTQTAAVVDLELDEVVKIEMSSDNQPEADQPLGSFVESNMPLNESDINHPNPGVSLELEADQPLGSRDELPLNEEQDTNHPNPGVLLELEADQPLGSRDELPLNEEADTNHPNPGVSLELEADQPLGSRDELPLNESDINHPNPGVSLELEADQPLGSRDELPLNEEADTNHPNPGVSLELEADQPLGSRDELPLNEEADTNHPNPGVSLELEADQPLGSRDELPLNEEADTNHPNPGVSLELEADQPLGSRDELPLNEEADTNHPNPGVSLELEADQPLGSRDELPLNEEQDTNHPNPGVSLELEADQPLGSRDELPLNEEADTNHPNPGVLLELEADEPLGSSVDLCVQSNEEPDQPFGPLGVVPGTCPIEGVSQESREVSDKCEDAECSKIEEDEEVKASFEAGQQGNQAQCVDSNLDMESMHPSDDEGVDTMFSENFETKVIEHQGSEDSVLKAPNLTGEHILNSLVSNSDLETSVKGIRNVKESDVAAGCILVAQSSIEASNPGLNELAMPTDSIRECQNLDKPCSSIKHPCETGSIEIPSLLEVDENMLVTDCGSATAIDSVNSAANEVGPAESQFVGDLECSKAGESNESATIENIQWGRLRKMKIPKSVELPTEKAIVNETDTGIFPTENIQLEQTGVEIGAARREEQWKETQNAIISAPSTQPMIDDSSSVVLPKEQVQEDRFVQPPKKRGRPKKVVTSSENYLPKSNVLDATNIATSSRTAEISQVSEAVKPIKKRGRPKKELGTDDNLPSASHSIVPSGEQGVDVTEPIKAIAPIEPINHRGRHKKEEATIEHVVPEGTPIEMSDYGPSSAVIEGLSVNNGSLETSTPEEIPKRRGRSRKGAVPLTNSTPSGTLNKSDGDGIVSGSDNPVEASPFVKPAKRGRKKEVLLVNASSAELNSALAQESSLTENLLTRSEENIVKPAVKRGRRSNIDSLETSTLNDSVASTSGKLPTKRGRPKKAAAASTVSTSLFGEAMETEASMLEPECGSLVTSPVAESVAPAPNKAAAKRGRAKKVANADTVADILPGNPTELECGSPVELPSQPVGKRGQKRKHIEDASEDNPVDENQEANLTAGLEEPSPGEVADEPAVKVSSARKQPPKKKGRWSKRPANASAAAKEQASDCPPAEKTEAPTAAVEAPATAVDAPVDAPAAVPSHGRGRKSAIALMYEESEIGREKGRPTDTIKCGKCELEMLRRQFLGHNKSKHCGLGWVSGEIPVDMKNLDQVRYCLAKMYNRRGRKEITCEVCKVSKRSIEGFVSHLELFCQKSSAEQEAMKVPCPVCLRVMLPTSLKVHMGVSHKSGLPEEPEPEEAPPRELGKRAAATKAAQLIAHLKIEEIEAAEKPPEDAEHAVEILNKELMVLYKKKGGPRKVNSLLNTRLRRELETRGIMACKNPGCSFASSEFEVMQMHYEMCKMIPTLVLRCIKCGYKCGDEEVMKDHVVNAPGHGKDAVKESEDSDFPDEGSECTDPEDVDLPRPPGAPRRSTLFNIHKNARLASRVKFLSKEISTKVMGDTMYLPSSKWWLQFQTENFQDSLFQTMQTPIGEMQRVEAAILNDYLPIERESVPLAMILLDKVAPTNPEPEPKVDSEWKRLKLFEATIIDDAPVMFVGGPVWAMAWCPIPTGLLTDPALSNVSQFLAVSCHRDMDDTYSVSSGQLGKGIIQIWDFGHMDHANPCGVPRMTLGLAHDAGAVWHMEWCPSGCYDSSRLHPRGPHRTMRRLGLLAAACSDGRIHIFSVPFPSELPVDGDSPPVYRVEPTVSLVSGGLREATRPDAWMCTRLSWLKSAGHAVLAGCFTNGMVSVWDIGATSPLLSGQQGPTRLVFAYHTFQAHMGSVTALSLFPYFNGRYLMTGGIDRLTKIWDLEQTQMPIATSFKGVVTDGIWLSHWVTTITAYDDGFGINHGNTMLHSVRNFGFNSHPLLPQNSPVWSLSGSEWSNAVAQGTAAGELCIIFPHQLFIGVDVEKSMKDKRMVISYVDVHDSAEAAQEVDPAAAATDGWLPPGPRHQASASVSGASEAPSRDNCSVGSSSKPASEESKEMSEASKDVSEASNDSDGSSACDEAELERDGANDSGQDNASDISLAPERTKLEEKVFLPGKYDKVANRFKLALCNYPVDNFKVFPNVARDTSRTSEQMRPVAREMFPIMAINRVSWNPNCTSHLWLASGYHCGLVRVPCLRGMQNVAFARELFSKPAK